jgi:glycine/D-amino acid oxidase-like deaminating enzyme
VGLDVVVVGAGVVGLSAGYELRRAGHRVTLVSADVPGSRQSAGRSRIFRLSHEDAGLTEAAARAREGWHEWERDARVRLLDEVGLLLTGDTAERERHLIPYGGLQHREGACHPLAVALPWALESTGACTHAEATVRFLQAGLELVLDEVISVGRGVVTLAGGARIDADRIVVCAGPDTYRLLGADEPERLRSVRFSFALREPIDAAAPCWIQRDPDLSDAFYAVMDGPDHYSVGLSEAQPAAVPEAEHVRRAHARTIDIVARLLPGLVPIAERVIACEFSLNPRAPRPALAHDGWDLREQDGVIGLTGPSLFKFAPLLGRLVEQRLRV